MKDRENPYTFGIWKVKPGKEEEFRKEWTAFAEWSSRNQIGAGTAYLLVDVDSPQTFISYGAWMNADLIAAWRGTPEFHAFAQRVRVLCDSFEPHLMTLVAMTGQ